MLHDRCSKHKLKKRNIYSVTGDQLYCESCLMFDPEFKDVARKEKLIEVTEIKKLEEEAERKLCYYREKETRRIKDSFTMKAKQTLEDSIINIENRYSELVERIELAKNQAIDEVHSEIKKLQSKWADFETRLQNYQLHINRTITLKQKLDLLHQI